MAKATCCYTWCSGRSILDTLNPDCWRALLSYIPVEEIIRSERVSRIWRERILEYLQGIQLSVEYVHPSIIKMFNWDPHPNSRLLTLNREEPPEQQGVLFSKLVTKFGPRIVFIGSDRITEADLGNIIWNCPNLESLLSSIQGLGSNPLPNSLLTLNRQEPPEQQGVLFSKLVTKFGPRIVFIGSDRITEADLGNIIWNCPNVESLLISSIEYYLPLEQLKCCSRLKRVAIHTCTIPDEYVSNLLNQVPLQELIINNASYVSGMFMTDPKLEKLKLLSITSCHNLMTEFFPDAEDLYGLTKLELVLNSPQVYRNVHQLLKNTPNLEDLSLVTFDKKVNVGTDFLNAIAKLKKLKRFYARFINNENDGWLEEVAVGCPSLTVMDIANCRGVTPTSLVTFCKARGPALLELGLAWNTELTDDDLTECLALCPNLKTLDVQGCVLISPRLVQTVRAHPRYWPLCLRVRRTRVPTDMRAECLWLILDFGY